MEQALQTYIQGILNSPEYKAYAAIRDKVKLYPDLKAKIDEFRARNYELQTSKDAAFEKLEALEREYEAFRDIPMVAEFLAAELAFCRMMQENNNVIMSAIAFE